MLTLLLDVLSCYNKNMIKKFCSVLLLTWILLCGCGKKEEVINDTLTAIKQKDILVVGVKTDTPPFGYLDKNGKNIGFDIELARLIAQRILGDPAKVSFVPVSPANRIMKLTSGEVDMIAATMSITPQRQMILDFSIPYHTAGQAIMVRKESKITSLLELEGKKAIIVFGSTVEKGLRSNVPNITIIGYKTYPEAFAALKAGKADAMIADDTILMGFAMNDKSVKILPKRYSKEPYAIAFRKDIESRNFIDEVNFVLKEALNRGDIRQLKSRYGIN